MILLDLFLSFLRIGMFSVGGGYAAIPLIQNQAVDTHGWLSLSEFTDLVTIAEMTPGPIAINSATFVGIRVASIEGALIATIGCIVPSLIIVTIMAKIYTKHKENPILKQSLAALRAAVVALIGCAGISILQMVLKNDSYFMIKGWNMQGLILSVAAFYVLRKWKKDPIVVMICCGIINVVVSLGLGCIM